MYVAAVWRAHLPSANVRDVDYCWEQFCTATRPPRPRAGPPGVGVAGGVCFTHFFTAEWRELVEAV